MQQSFEQLNSRAVAVVVDPIQSVKGKVVIDAFRLINPQIAAIGHEARQTTSNIGHLNKPSIQALIHGLNRHYYSIAINYRKNELEQKMLLNLHKKNWTSGLTLANFHEHTEENEKAVKVSKIRAILTQLSAGHTARMPWTVYSHRIVIYRFTITLLFRQCCPWPKPTTSQFKKSTH